jgi:hypothetical protein
MEKAYNAACYKAIEANWDEMFYIRKRDLHPSRRTNPSRFAMRKN